MMADQLSARLQVAECGGDVSAPWDVGRAPEPQRGHHWFLFRNLSCDGRGDINATNICGMLRLGRALRPSLRVRKAHWLTHLHGADVPASSEELGCKRAPAS